MGKPKRLKASGSQRIKPPQPVVISTDHEKPIFCLRYMPDLHSVEQCEQEERASFASKLFQLSQLTWQQLKQTSRHGQGFEKISRDALKAPIPSSITPDVDFLAFRFYAKAPMVGYRDGQVFHVVWLDRAFNLYNHS